VRRQHGRAAEVLDRPADADCARLLGFETIIPAALSDRVLGGGTGDVALRSEDCFVEPVGPASCASGTAVRLTGVLRRVVPLGPVSRGAVTVGNDSLIATASTPAPAWLGELRPGDAIVLRFDRERARPLRDGAGRSRAAA
jgi:tungstate transport system ATP-binding protein